MKNKIMPLTISLLFLITINAVSQRTTFSGSLSDKFTTYASKSVIIGYKDDESTNRKAEDEFVYIKTKNGEATTLKIGNYGDLVVTSYQAMKDEDQQQYNTTYYNCKNTNGKQVRLFIAQQKPLQGEWFRTTHWVIIIWDSENSNFIPKGNVMEMVILEMR